jgi:dTDP-4-amino-4,6-dideoxygalactose transaminase
MPYEITRRFERALCEYTGAPFAVAVNSGTAAILLAVEWHRLNADWSRTIEIPKRTYVSVPCAIIDAGGRPRFRDEGWSGVYQLKPLPVWDCARRFTSGMYVPGQFQCVSFAAAKILGAEQGGAILHDNAEADAWFRRMRFDGRTEGVDPLEDTFDLVGHHCIMIPSVAATLLVRLHHLPKHNEDLGPHTYPDLSLHPAFK